MPSIFHLEHAIERADCSVPNRSAPDYPATAFFTEPAAPSNPHRDHTDCTAPRGFLPWRLSDAGPHGPLIDRDGPASETLVWTAPASQGFLQVGRVWSIAVMCPASVCGRVDRGPRWVTRIGPQTSRRGLGPK